MKLLQTQLKIKFIVLYYIALYYFELMHQIYTVRTLYVYVIHMYTHVRIQ